MNILMLEPYYTGSHANWIEGYKKYSSLNVETIGMKGRFWKWRMHGGAVHMADEFLKSDLSPDLIIASDMLDLSLFSSLCRHRLGNTKLALYFHENQLSYPWSDSDNDRDSGRDFHYCFINYACALSADICFFNSRYHMDSFLDSLEPMLKRLPDYNCLSSIDKIRKKSCVLPLGLEYKNFDDAFRLENSLKTGCAQKSSSRPLILWNHRWEYDKNPEDFFNALFLLQQKGLDFEVAVLGESYSKSPEIFARAKHILKDKIAAFGKVNSFSEYAQWLCRSDILPVTSNQEFFGISVMEAAYCGCFPILPDRLTYPDLFNKKLHPQNFYSDFDGFVGMLEHSILNFRELETGAFKSIASNYSWQNMAPHYDCVFRSVLKNSLNLY